MANKGKYANYKLAWYPDKVKSFIDKTVTPPPYVRIKPSNKCPQKCWFCCYTSDTSDMHRTCNTTDVMPSNKLIETINDVADIGTKGVVFAGGGEPLAHPAILDAFDLCVTRGLKYGILTNGQLLTNKAAQHLKTASWIRISIDYWDGESLQRFRGVKPKFFDVIMDNWRNMINVKGEKCDVEINFITTQDNYEHIFDAIEMVKSYGSENIRFCPVYTKDFVGYHIPIKEKVYSILAEARRRYEDDKFEIYSTYDSIDDVPLYRPYTFCGFAQIAPVIAADMNCYVCHDRAFDPKGLFGSIKDQKFSELWFSAETRKYLYEFNAQERCNGYQCSSEGRNLFILDMMNCYGDPFI